ncbi:hypothetical protein B0T24DRAFT_195720 [Lasiosphaeria ovina]|uniref:ER transporter 6TM N-terminal domain-containing protein n=1 Tax=Lasiosphaeria ovina TaxID=92902 RepID=A0AAE0TUT9_9PEZI|nr:hypothetical protein B0T24DRAFT_195720 [Lasiosphaeria ovina]
MYQSTTVASYFTTLGYLVPIISVIALPILPRGKFLMNLLLSVLGVCLGSAVALLMLWSSIKAREHTTPPGSTKIYNSSQSAVCAVWLFANIYFINVVRAKLPSLNSPVIIYSILVNIAATFGPLMRTVAAAEAFVQQLLTAMLAAFALAAGVNLIVLPISSRLVVFKELASLVGLLRRTVSLQKAYLVSIESEDMFSAATRTQTLLAAEAKKRHGGADKPKLTKEAKAAAALRGISAALRELSGKLHADMPFAKRDFARGKLDANDLGEIFMLFRNVYIPVMGISTIIDIFKRVSERRKWQVGDDAPEEVIAEKNIEKRVWNEVMKQMHEPFEILSEAIDQGLEHAALCLELIPRPKKDAAHSITAQNPEDEDVEARGQEIRPGTPEFAKLLDEKVKAFYSKKGELLRTWVKQRDIAIDEEYSGDPQHEASAERKERSQAQLYIVLYMENLMHASGEAVQNLVTFADKKVKDGTMSKKRFILPTSRRLRKWLLGAFSTEDSSAEQSPDLMETSATIVYFGDGYNRKKDPEHLDPATAWQHFGNGLRKVPAFFGSEESAFGFRVACATMTIAIVAFLEDTQVFFMEQRLVWAMIIIAIGMTMTSGQSVFGFLCRVAGTVIAMVLSLVIWYIVDENVPGIIVFLWLSLFICYYFFLKFPNFIPAILIAMVTQVLIIGYELQVLKIGEAASERTGQPVYKIYLLGPYRLANVAGGSLVAFFWTIFPSPLTDRTWLRRDLAATLYLVANYFGVISSTIRSNVDGSGGDVSIPGTPAYQLFNAGRKIFGKVMLLVPSMSQHSEWQKWEPTIGGKFPRAAYDEIILRSTRIMGYLTLMSYTLTHPTLEEPKPSGKDANGETTETEDGQDRQAKSRQLSSRSGPASDAASISSESKEWLDALAEVLSALEPAHHTILSTLTLLSNSLLSGQRLPPFLPLPRPYEMTRRLVNLGQPESFERESAAYDDTLKLGDLGPSGSRQTSSGNTVASILDPRNMEQPGYAEFAVLQVCNTLVCDDLEGLMKAVAGLVGVVDFSFRIARSESTLGSSGGGTKVSGGEALRKIFSKPLASNGDKGKGKVD